MFITAYQQGILSVVQSFHSGNAPGLVEIRKTAYADSFAVPSVYCLCSHISIFLNIIHHRHGSCPPVMDDCCQ